MRETAHRTVRTRGALEVEIGERVRVTRAGRYAELPQQRLADECGGLPRASPTPRFTLGSRKRIGMQLRVAVGDVQQRDVAERLQRA